ncbi:MAG: site-specific DNA-methyltransferase [Oculatellaceae cyanobacterium Prado106]|nr:site-specific DNA-methyltransferase [Oculatellaceae cyanobacterium Prado106]
MNFISQSQENTYNAATLAEDCTIIHGDSRTELARMPEKIFQRCVTSPPYWGLRDYDTDRQIGAEECLEDYIKNLVSVFREVRRTLVDDGTLWLNIGDSYTSGNRTWRDNDKKNPARGMNYRPPTPDGLKPKDLIGVPWRIAFALQADGCYLRSDIIWHKPNCQPESVKDRPTRSHEYMFLFSKSERYYYDSEAIKEPTHTNGQKKNKRTVWLMNALETVWNINAEPFKGAHFAVFPRSLIRPCILAGSQEGSLVLDPFFGSGTTGEVCLEARRKCVGIELKSEYIDVATNRLRNSQLQLSI